MPAAKRVLCVMIAALFLSSCSTAYKAKPLPFRAPESYSNAAEVAGAVIGAQAYADKKQAREAFGFDVVGAGLLPVQVVFDNRGKHPLEINPDQTFLEDEEGKLWPILSRDMAYKRATKYAKTESIVKEGAYHGALTAAAGALIGAAIGIVTGRNVGTAIAHGAVVGGAAGATVGGMKGYGSDEARHAIISDLRRKSLQNLPIQPHTLAHGFLFFPAEAGSPKKLRLQIVEEDTKTRHVLMLDLGAQQGAGQ